MKEQQDVQIIDSKKYANFREEVSNKLPAVIPTYFKIGEAISKGDCFYDAVAQGLNQLGFGSVQTIKSLRKLCYIHVTDKKNTSIRDEILKDELTEDSFNSYLMRLPYTSSEMEAMEKQKMLVGSATWGRPDLEGRIICQHFNVRLHVIDVHEEAIDDQLQATECLVDAQGVHQIEEMLEEAYTHLDIIHIINYKNHYVPLLNSLANENIFTRSCNILKQNPGKTLLAAGFIVSLGIFAFKYATNTNENGVIDTMEASL